MKRKHPLQVKLLKHIEENSFIYLFICVLLLVGVIFGAITVNSIHSNQKGDVMSYLNQFLGQVSQGKIGNSSTIMKESFFSHMKYIGLIWVLGISIIGLPIILIMLFIKGITVGFTVGFLVDGLGMKGFTLALVSVLPQNLLVIPIYIVSSTVAVSFSIRLIRFYFVKRKHMSFLPFFIRYTLTFVVIGVGLGVASLFEAYVSPGLMKQVIDTMK